MRQSKSFSKQQRAKMIFRTVVFLIGLAVFLAVTSWLSKLSFWSINSIQIGGIDQSGVPALQAGVENILNGSYLGIFSKRNIILYPKSAINAYLKDHDSKIEDANIHVEGLHQLSISLITKVPRAIVCPTFPDSDIIGTATSTPEGCYYSDDQGQLFTKAPVMSNDIYPVYFTPDLLDDVSSSTLPVVLSNFSQFQSAYLALKSAGLDVQAMLINDNGEYEFYVNYPVVYSSKKISPTSSKEEIHTVFVFMNNDRPLKNQVDNFLLFWPRIQPAGSVATTSLDYIDVRYGSNVFYR